MNDLFFNQPYSYTTNTISNLQDEEFDEFDAVDDSYDFVSPRNISSDIDIRYEKALAYLETAELALKTSEINFFIDIQTRLIENLIRKTSTISISRIIDIPEFPEEIDEVFKKLELDTDNEDLLYDIAEEVTEWLIDNLEDYQVALIIRLRSLPEMSIRILISSFCDAEMIIDNQSFLDYLAYLLKSNDKELAQSAASCLLTCGKEKGRKILQYYLENVKELPHLKLIKGISNILT